MGDRLEVHSVSVVIPAFNASATLGETLTRALTTLEASYDDYELIVVDDGSGDGTWRIIREHAASNSHVRGIRLLRNFGQTSALCAGIEASSAEVLAAIDADLDTYPEDIPKLIEAIAAGADMANGARVRRNWRRNLPSRVFNRRMRRIGVDLVDVGCGMFAVRRQIATEALEHGELRRSFRFKVLLAALTTDVVEIPVRSGHHYPSSHRLADLLSAGIETDVAFNRTAFLGTATFGAVIGLVGVVGSLVMFVWSGLSGAGTIFWVGAWAAVLGMVGLTLGLVAVGTNLVLRGLHHQGTPFVRVGTTVGGDDNVQASAER